MEESVTVGDEGGERAEDAALVRSCLEGVRGAFEGLIERHRRVVHHAVRAALGRAGARPDPEICDESFARAFSTLAEADMRALRSWRGDAKLSTFLVVIARRAALRVLGERRQGTPAAVQGGAASLSLDQEGAPGEPAARDADPAERASEAELRALLRSELAALSHRDALVLRLFYDEGLKHREIGKVIGVPTTHVGQILSRARDKLKARLARAGLGEDDGG